jgi:hypothetical protein
MMALTHIGGPLEGEALSIAAPATPRRLFYAPAPDGVPSPFQQAGYILVGYDQAPVKPWPGQVEYRLDRELSELHPHPEYDGMEQGTAAYVVVV